MSKPASPPSHPQHPPKPADPPAKPEIAGQKPPPRKLVLLSAGHGGHLIKAQAAPSITDVSRAETRSDEIVFETPFDYLFPALTNDAAAHLPADDPGKIAEVVAGLNALGDAMVEEPPAAGEDPLQPTGNSTIPPVYTYWGQFIDHDLTANTDRDSSVSNITQPQLAPLAPAFVVENLKNLRQPAVNLDSVYGDGPTFGLEARTQAERMYDGIKMRVGTVAINPSVPPIPGVPIPTEGDHLRDLPRVGALVSQGLLKPENFPEELRNKPNFEQLAFIADARNDENLIVAQFHTGVLRFHNAMVDWVAKNGPADIRKQSERAQFECVQKLVRWHYQWLVIHDYLKTVTMPGIVDDVLLGGPKHYKLRKGEEPYMPLEFSVAAYRFGHTMVRAVYDHNRNFGRPGNVIPTASFDLLFAFTGGGSTRNSSTGAVTLNPFLGNTKVLPFNWIIEWDRFTDKGSSIPDHFARKIDTRLAPPLKDMVNQGNDPALDTTPDIRKILKMLARRNLLRGYHLSIPTGQAVAAKMGVLPLTADELRQGNSSGLNQVLQDNGFINRTPLWYYVLKEAEVRANGNSLGELGSRIVCETIIGQLLNDPDSYLRQPGGWNPGHGAKLPNGELIVTIRHFFRFAGLVA